METEVKDLTLVDETPRAVVHQPAMPDNSPTGMMLAMLGQGATLEQIEKMMDLQERFEQRESVKKFNAAFALFKAEAVRVVKNRAVTAGPLAGKSYAELFSVVDAVTPALSKHGLSAAWRLTRDEKDWIEVTCTIKHSAGHSESVSMGGPPDVGGAKNAIQARASTISYLERYTLKAICGIAEGGDDNDGSGATADDDEELSRWQDAALGGEATLRNYYEKHTPSDAFWKKHSRALKAAAKAADKAAQ